MDRDSHEINTLIELGLSEKEALIYLAALQTGGCSITELAKMAGIERTGIYYHIDKLIEQNLLKEETSGKRSIYLPESPKVLSSLLEDRQKMLEKVLPGLETHYMQQTSQSVSENFIGKDRVQAFYDRLYEIFCNMKTPQEKLVYCFGHSYRAVRKTGVEFMDYHPPLQKIDIHTKTILPLSQKSKIDAENDMDPYMVTRYNLPISEKRYIKDKSFPSPVVIVGNYVTLFDYTNYILSITENKNMATTWRTIFEYIWDTLK